MEQTIQIYKLKKYMITQNIETLKKAIEKTFKYKFKNTNLLKIAITHKSSQKENNERLEFLGDSILNFLITKKIYKLYPEKSEGKLTNIRSNLISNNKLLKIANKLKIKNNIITGNSIKNINDSIIINTLEAVIGSIYLDSNIETIENITNCIYKKIINTNTLTIKDPKSTLQEYLQHINIPIPNYKIIKTYGKMHNKTFLIKCKINKLNIHTISIGKSIKYAEKICAQKIINKIAYDI